MLIRCPECGQQVSDQAPVCPHCGVELQKILSLRGERAFVNGQNAVESGERIVSQLYSQPTVQQQAPQQPVQNLQPAASSQQPTANSQQPEPESKKGASFYLCIVLAAMLFIGLCFWGYNSFFGSQAGEAEAYELAMKSEDINEMQNYLTDYKDAPQEHIQAVEARIEMINGLNREWNDVLVSGSRSALQGWIDQHPDGPFKEVALHKLDSLDFESASKANTAEALKSYIDQHSNGDYVDEANDRIRNLQANTVQPDEKQMVSSVIKSFYQSLNTKDDDRLTSSVSNLLQSFLGKSNATKADVSSFLKKLWKDDVTNINFILGNDYNISKKEIGDAEYEYTADFTVVQQTEKSSGTTTTNYHVTAKLNSDGKITSLSMRQ